MVKLSEFIGEIVSDISDARKIADSNSVAMSQSYSADPFLKGMPVPHYTIEEAKVEFPVTVTGIVSNSRGHQVIKSHVLEAISKKCPQLLNNLLLRFYRKKVVMLSRLEAERRQALVTAATGEKRDNEKTDNQLDEADVTISDELKNRYAASSNVVAAELRELMKNFLDSANLEIVKLLDIKDKLEELLIIILRNEFSSYNSDERPFDDKLIEELGKEIGNGMFFEFKQLSEEEKGVFVEATTGRMNEYAVKDNLMFLTIKIKEQDLELVVEESDSAENAQRFLSLN